MNKSYNSIFPSLQSRVISKLARCMDPCPTSYLPTTDSSFYLQGATFKAPSDNKPLKYSGTH